MTLSNLRRGRHTHDVDAAQDAVTFLVGMTIHRWWRPDAWLPPFLAMPAMLAELQRDPDSGLLGYQLMFGRRGPTVLQYWRSAADLYGYAAQSDRKHRPAWAAFNRRAKQKPGLVGIWHETYGAPIRHRIAG